MQDGRRVPLDGATSHFGERHELARRLARHGGTADTAWTFEGDGARVQLIVADLAIHEGVDEVFADDAVMLDAELEPIRLDVVSTIHLAERVTPDPAADEPRHVFPPLSTREIAVGAAETPGSGSGPRRGTPERVGRGTQGGGVETATSA